MPLTINYKNSTLSYQLFGGGKEYLLAFHGYGKDAESLQVLEKHCGEKYTIVSIDIPFHGNSVWNEEKGLTQKEWKTIITLLLNELGNPEKFSVFGYSIGGQAATCTTWLFKERVNTLWLMAATGIGNDGWYHIAVNTQFGETLFKLFVTKPNFILWPLKWLTALRFFTPTYKAFIERKIDTLEKRELLYKRWMVLKHFGVYTDKLKKQLNTNNTKVLLVYGNKDVVVKPAAGKLFAKGIKNVALLLPSEGHHILTDKVLAKAATHLQ